MAFYEIIDHGYMHEDAFSGCSTSYTDCDGVQNGIGINAKEAYLDAHGAIFMSLGTNANKLHLPTRPRGIRQRDRVPAHAGNGVWYYVSIRYSLEK